jgi:hypothetical protein
MNKEIKDILQGAVIVKFIRSSRIRQYGHVERMKNQRMPKQIAAATTEGIRKRGRPCKRWKDEVEEDLNIMGIKNRCVQQPGTARNGRRLYCKPRSTMDCSASEEEVVLTVKYSSSSLQILGLKGLL